MQKLILSTLLIRSTFATLRADDPASAEPSSDPLAAILQPHLEPTVAVLLDHYRTKRKYVNSDFPMPRQKFEEVKAGIGATGVSLGGWLAVQTAMLNDRITAVADFGRKTRSVPADLQPQQ